MLLWCTSCMWSSVVVLEWLQISASTLNSRRKILLACSCDLEARRFLSLSLLSMDILPYYHVVKINVHSTFTITPSYFSWLCDCSGLLREWPSETDTRCSYSWWYWRKAISVPWNYSYVHHISCTAEWILMCSRLEKRLSTHFFTICNLPPSKWCMCMLIFLLYSYM